MGISVGCGWWGGRGAEAPQLRLQRLERSAARHQRHPEQGLGQGGIAALGGLIDAQQALLGAARRGRHGAGVTLLGFRRCGLKGHHSPITSRSALGPQGQLQPITGLHRRQRPGQGATDRCLGAGQLRPQHQLTAAELDLIERNGPAPASAVDPGRAPPHQWARTPSGLAPADTPFAPYSTGFHPPTPAAVAAPGSSGAAPAANGREAPDAGLRIPLAPRS